jgi:molybdopterin converting factor small subunit
MPTPEPRSPARERGRTMHGMAVVCLRGPLRKLAGGRAEHELRGETVVDLLKCLELAYPEIDGWILDERRLIRRHINVFVNGERGGEETAVRSGDRVEVLPAITGG